MKKCCAAIISDSSFNSFNGIFDMLLATIHPPARVIQILVDEAEGFPLHK